MTESVVSIGGADAPLVGIMHHPQTDRVSRTAVLVLVGGPQYRVGSHRQFVELARALAQSGYPTLRFDFRGMGDSAGQPRHYLNNSADIRAAIEFLLTQDGVDHVVLWGLCDAASAALLHARSEAGVAGLVLLNPWVRMPQLAAQSMVKNYYRGKLFSGDYWRRLLSGKVNLLAALKSFLATLVASRKSPDSANRDASNTAAMDVATEGNYVDLMLASLQSFAGPSLIILSERDMTADEFVTLCGNNAQWQRALQDSKCTSLTVADANHTFSNAIWKREVELQTVQWLNAHF